MAIRPLMFGEKKIHIIGRADQMVRDYFHEHANAAKAPAKDLMDTFISKRILLKDNRDGFPIRRLLRKLDAANKQHLLKHVKMIRNEVNRNWYFVRT